MALLLGADVHRAELRDLERAPVPAAPRLPVDGCAGALEPNRQRDRGEQRREQYEREAGDGDVEAPLEQTRAPPEPHRRQRHQRHALDVVERRVRGEDLEVARDDRDLDVGPADRPDHVEHLLVARHRRREQHPVDLELVHDRCHVARRPEDRAELAVTLAVEEADDLEAVLGVRLELPVDELCLGAAAHDERAARLHQAREEPASNGAAGDRDEDEGRDQEQRRLDRRVDPPAGEMAQALGEDQEDQRARRASRGRCRAPRRSSRRRSSGCRSRRGGRR